MLAFALLPGAADAIPPTPFKVFAILRRFADRGGRAWPGQRKLAALVGMSLTTINRAIRWLVEHGVLVKHGPAWFGKTCRYEIAPDFLRVERKAPGGSAAPPAAADETRGAADETRGAVEPEPEGPLSRARARRIRSTGGTQGKASKKQPPDSESLSPELRAHEAEKAGKSTEGEVSETPFGRPPCSGQGQALFGPGAGSGSTPAAASPTPSPDAAAAVIDAAPGRPPIRLPDKPGPQQRCIRRVYLLRRLRHWLAVKGTQAEHAEAWALIGRMSAAVADWSHRAPEDRVAFDELVKQARADPLPVFQPGDRRGRDPGLDALMARQGWTHGGGGGGRAAAPPVGVVVWEPAALKPPKMLDPRPEAMFARSGWFHGKGRP